MLILGPELYPTSRLFVPRIVSTVIKVPEAMRILSRGFVISDDLEAASALPLRAFKHFLVDSGFNWHSACKGRSPTQGRFFKMRSGDHFLQPVILGLETAGEDGYDITPAKVHVILHEGYAR